MLRPPWRLGILAIPALLLILVSEADGQDDAEEARAVAVWLSAGYGVGTAESLEGLEEAVTLALSVQWKRLVLSGRTAWVRPSFEETALDLGFLVGLGTLPGRPFHASLALGLGIDDRYRLTVPLEAQVLWRFFRYFGLGLYGFASIGEDSFAGVAASLRVGLLR